MVSEKGEAVVEAFRRGELNEADVRALCEAAEILAGMLAAKETLRDRFAMAALPLVPERSAAGALFAESDRATRAYMFADAMLAAREAKR